MFVQSEDVSLESFQMSVSFSYSEEIRFEERIEEVLFFCDKSRVEFFSKTAIHSPS
jgi:hypothetical protein